VVIDQYQVEQQWARRIATLSFDERVQLVLDDYFRCRVIVAMTSWYGDGILPCQHLMGARKREELFGNGDAPCLLRGSVFVMQHRRSIQWHLPHDVVLRFIRRKKLTILDWNDWDGLLGRDRLITRVIRRVTDKFGGDPSRVQDHVSGYGRTAVFVAGEQIRSLSPEKLDTVRKMQKIVNSLDIISKESAA
jgi:hypothetical protein